MGFPQIILVAMPLSMAIPLTLACLPRRWSNRLVIAVLTIVIPTLFVSCSSFFAQGRFGFLSVSQGLCTGSFILAVVTILYSVARGRHEDSITDGLPVKTEDEEDSSLA